MERRLVDVRGFRFNFPVAIGEQYFSFADAAPNTLRFQLNEMVEVTRVSVSGGAISGLMPAAPPEYLSVMLFGINMAGEYSPNAGGELINNSPTLLTAQKQDQNKVIIVNPNAPYYTKGFICAGFVVSAIGMRLPEPATVAGNVIIRVLIETVRNNIVTNNKDF